MHDEQTLQGLACLRLRLHAAFAHCCQHGVRNLPLRLVDAVQAAAVVFSEEGFTNEDAPVGPPVRGRCAPPPPPNLFLGFIPVCATTVTCYLRGRSYRP